MTEMTSDFALTFTATTFDSGPQSSSQNGSTNANVFFETTKETQPAVTALKATFMACVISTAIFGNLLVIVSVLRFERLRLIANTFIVSLAFTDLLVACLVMPFSASKELVGRWIYGQLACDIFNANDVLFSTASLLHLCCISVDRYVAITDPLHYENRLTGRHVAFMLTGVWLASAIISHIPIHLWWYTTPEHKDTMMKPGGDPYCTFEVNQVYAVISSTVSFWTPATIMVFAYRKIYQEATKQQKCIESMTALSSREPSTDRLQYSLGDDSYQAPVNDQYHGTAPDSCRNLGQVVVVFRNSDHSPDLDRKLTSSVDRNLNDSPDRTPDRTLKRNLDRSFDRNLNRNIDRSVCQTRKKMKREHKAAKTLGAILGAFLFCWLPFFTWYLTTALCGPTCYTPRSVEATLFWVGYLNSAINPVIYALLNRDFRDAFRRLLWCRRRSKDTVLDQRKTVTASMEELSLR